MFNNADAFNQALGWPVTQPALTNTSGMFTGTALFNGDVSTLDMSDVTDATDMFKNAAAFNQPVSAWTLGSAVDISDMFSGATAFNQDISGWDFEGVTRFGQFLNNSGLANANEASGVYNYNLFLQALAFAERAAKQRDRINGRGSHDRLIPGEVLARPGSRRAGNC